MTAEGELEFQPGSRGRVLRNLLGITQVREMEVAETQALFVAQANARRMYGSGHRFTSADIRRLHRMWLGEIYPWAGNYRTVNIGKGGFQFAHAPLISRLMAVFSKEVLRRHTPCGVAADIAVARSLAEVHANVCTGYPDGDEPGLQAARVAFFFRNRRSLATRSRQYLTKSAMVFGQYVRLPSAKG
jgi:cell filamentation protein